MNVDPSRLAGEPAPNEAEGVASATGVGLTAGEPSFLGAKPKGIRVGLLASGERRLPSLHSISKLACSPVHRQVSELGLEVISRLLDPIAC